MGGRSNRTPAEIEETAPVERRRYRNRQDGRMVDLSDEERAGVVDPDDWQLWTDFCAEQGRVMEAANG